MVRELRSPPAHLTGRWAGFVLAERFFFFSSRRRHTRCSRDWSSDVCSSDLHDQPQLIMLAVPVAVAPPAGAAPKVTVGVKVLGYLPRLVTFTLVTLPPVVTVVEIGRASCRERVEKTVMGGGVKGKKNRMLG